MDTKLSWPEGHKAVLAGGTALAQRAAVGTVLTSALEGTPSDRRVRLCNFLKHENSLLKNVQENVGGQVCTGQPGKNWSVEGHPWQWL